MHKSIMNIYRNIHNWNVAILKQKYWQLPNIKRKFISNTVPYNGNSKHEKEKGKD